MLKHKIDSLQKLFIRVHSNFCMPFSFFKNRLTPKAQGTIEYLVIFAVVIVIGLFVVSLLLNLFSNTDSSEKLSKLEWSSKEVALLDGIIDEDGNWVLVIKNNGSERITLQSIILGSTELDLGSIQLASFESKSLMFVNEYATQGCTSNTVSFNFTLNYTSSEGLAKTITGTQEFFLTCVTSVVQTPNYLVLGEENLEDDEGGEIVFSEPGFEINLVGENEVTFWDSRINFSFFIENYPAIKDCSLILNDVNVLTKIPNEFNFSSLNTFTHNLLASGIYSWDINCTDTNNIVIASENGPFLLNLPREFTTIQNCLQLQDMNLHLDGNYILENDIDCASDTNNSSGALWNNGAGFAPIGNSSTNFSGTFDGAGYTISGLYINRSTTSYVGLFGYTSSTALIANLKITDANISGKDYVGGLIGYSQGDVSKCSYDGIVRGANQYAGGLIGYLQSGRLFGSYTKGTLYSKQYSGGLVGYTNDTTTYLYDVYSQMNVFATSSYTGGLIGLCKRTYIIKSYSTGIVSSTISTGLGGFVGSNSISACYANNSFWDTTTSTRATSALGVGKTTAQMKTQTTFAGFDFENMWNYSSEEYPSLKEYLVYLSSPTGVEFSAGSGTTQDPYQISTCGEFQKIAYESMDANYILLNDLNCSDSLSWVMGRGFTQIGTSSAPFSGSFNGNNFLINNLIINRPIFQNIGVFGYTSATSLIANINLVNASVSGSNYVGGLIGYSNGGVAKSSFDGFVYGRNQYAGGLIGYIATGTIFGSYSKGNLYSNQYSGGLIGYAVSSSVSYLFDIYSQMNVFATSSYTGGLIGLCENTYIARSYSTGIVSSTSPTGLGGLIGSGASDCYTNRTFWDTTTSTLATSSKGVGKNTTEMKTQTTYAGFDFNNLWNYSNEEYPTLKNYSVYLNAPSTISFSGGTGSLIDPYQISNCNQLQLASSNRDSNFILVNDINCSDTTYWSMGTGFTSIGTSASIQFLGNFNGAHYNIYNLYINRPFSSNRGLIGYASSNSLIENLNVINSSISGSTNVGGIVGYNTGDINSCYFEGLIYGRNQYAGGIVGAMSGGGTITKSYSQGEISAHENVGGVLGGSIGNTTSYLSDSYSNMSVSGTWARVAGLIGFCDYLTVSRTYANGLVRFVGTGSANYVSGLVGDYSTCTVNNSFWDTTTSTWLTSARGTGKTTAQMKQQATYTGWTFPTVWTITEGISYPSLTNFSN